MLSDTIFGLAFMQRAFLAALVIGLAAPAIGTYLVQRRLALMGDGLGHVALTGVGLGLITKTSPVALPRARISSIAVAPAIDTSTAVRTGALPVSRPSATPVIAMWPMPSPSSDSRRCTR